MIRSARPNGDALGMTGTSVQMRLDSIAEEFEKLHQECDPEASVVTKTDRGLPKKRGRMAEEVEDKLMLKRAEADTSGKARAKLDTQPQRLKNGKLRDYQLEGVRWLVHLYQNSINGILADEMGLGKTVQAIGMIAYLAEHVPGNKSCVIAPKSVLSNWIKEFTKWLPSLRVIMIGGSKEERATQVLDVKAGKFDVVVTSFEVVTIERAALRKVSWRYMVIDEAHRLKNENSILSQVVREFKTHSRLLLTGTPLQNNLHELWALLNFLLPSHFGEAEEFDRLFQSSDTAQHVTMRLQRILRPFLLRRLKSEVEAGLPPKTEVNLTVPLSVMQRKLYANVLKRDVDAINGRGGDKSRLLNIVMQLRKVCNHPYLFEGQEPGPPFVEGEHLIDNCSKLKVLDGLLDKAKEEGARVLIFSQMTRMLDILEDYCLFRGHSYCRIDGGVSGEEREEQIEDFMREGSDRRLFLLSTRAGGLGLNLQKANWVVLYDSDWNPQADIQAMDRCHRIGQTKPVRVFRLVAERSVEERMVERAMKKLFLDAMVVQQGRLSEKNASADKEQLLEMIRFGADTVMRISNVEKLDLDKILRDGKIETEKLKAKLKDMAATSMCETFRSDGGSYGKSYADEGSGDEGGGGGRGGEAASSEFVLEIGRRERKEVQYNVDEVLREQSRTAKEEEEEEKEERRRVREEAKETGWTPDPKSRRSVDSELADGRRAGAAAGNGGKAGPADLLLRRLVEEGRARVAGGGGSGEEEEDGGEGVGRECEYFQLRGPGRHYVGRFDSEWMIVGECQGSEDEEEDDDGGSVDGETKRFPSLSTWAYACRGRPVSVKPVVFYRNKSLRQYEIEAAEAAIRAACAQGWEGPTDPAGVVAWCGAVKEGVRGRLSVGEEEVERMVRQELEGRVVEVCREALREPPGEGGGGGAEVVVASGGSGAAAGAVAEAGAARGAGAGGGAEPDEGSGEEEGKRKGGGLLGPRPVLPDALLGQLLETVTRSGLYRDGPSALKALLKKGGVPDPFLELLFPPCRLAGGAAVKTKGKAAAAGAARESPGEGAGVPQSQDGPDAAAAAAAQTPEMRAEAKKEEAAEAAEREERARELAVSQQLPLFAAAFAAAEAAARTVTQAAKESKKAKAKAKAKSKARPPPAKASTASPLPPPLTVRVLDSSEEKGVRDKEGGSEAVVEGWIVFDESGERETDLDRRSEGEGGGEGGAAGRGAGAAGGSKRKRGGAGEESSGRGPRKTVKVADRGEGTGKRADRQEEQVERPLGEGAAGGGGARMGGVMEAEAEGSEKGRTGGPMEGKESREKQDRGSEEAPARAREAFVRGTVPAAAAVTASRPGEGLKESEKRKESCAVSEEELAERVVGKVSIKKLFPAFGFFSGVVSAYDAAEKLFTVHYEDDDEEEFTLEELRPYVLQTEHAHLFEGVGSASPSPGGARGVKKARLGGGAGGAPTAHAELLSLLTDLKFTSKHWTVIRKEIARDEACDVDKARKWVKKVELNLPFKVVLPEFADARPTFVESLEGSSTHLDLIELIGHLRLNIKPEFLRRR